MIEAGRKRVGRREALGLLPLGERLRQARVALLGAPHVPPSRYDLGSLSLVVPRWGWPLWRGRWVVPGKVLITNLFNHRQTPVGEGWSVRRTSTLDFRGGSMTYDSHNGTDLCVPVGTTVVAPAPGRVVRVWSEFNRGGLKVAIDHGGGLMTSSAHLARTWVRVGQELGAAEPFALSGYSGLDGLVTFPFGLPHVHFNVWLDGVPVDPFARVGSGEASLWTTEPPSPGAGVGAPPAEIDQEAVRATLGGCLDRSTAERLAGIRDPRDRVGALIAEVNYYPTRFPVSPRPFVEVHPRTPRLALPFATDTVSGVVFADALR